MTCIDIIPTTLGNIIDLDVIIAMDHTYIGDLVMKLKVDSTTILLFHGNEITSGSNSNLDPGYPITFSNTQPGAVPANQMGESLGGSNYVCLDDGVCTFAPDLDSLSRLSHQLIIPGVTSIQLCVGDRAPSDTGSIHLGKVVGSVTCGVTLKPTIKPTPKPSIRPTLCAIPFNYINDLSGSPVPVPDNGYHGDDSTLTCVDVTASIQGFIDLIDVQIAIDHTYIGDLTMKLKIDGTTILLFDGSETTKPDGHPYGSSNLDPQYPITFSNSQLGAIPVSQMGNTLSDNDIVCGTDGKCLYSPDRDSLTSLLNKLIIPGTTSIQVCVGDDVTSDFGSIHFVSVSGYYFCGTSATPTRLPTHKPTVKPTTKPTVKPTVKPTKVPTKKPTT
jgi:hypothetical protein